MADYHALAESYLAAWNDTEQQSRRTRLTQVFASEVAYTDPMAQVVGLDQLDATIGAVQGQFPGWTFRLAGDVDGHHDQLRFTWDLGPEGEEPPVVGFDAVTLDGDGRIDRVIGFLDKAPG